MRKLPPRAARVPEATRPLSGCEQLDPRRVPDTANLRTKILDFGGFDSSRIFSLRVGILMSIGDFPESLSQAILVGIILVGRLGAQDGQPLPVQRSVLCACRAKYDNGRLAFAHDAGGAFVQTRKPRV